MFDWLPDHQLQVASTLAHADELIARVGDAALMYTLAGALELRDVYEGDSCLATVSAVKPLPASVSRYTADALTQLRAAVEHAVYAEVERGLGRSLTVDEARAIEMPACADNERFREWLNHKVRRTLAPLQPGSPLVDRIEALQPYHRRDAAHHPLRLLVEHTNLAKHRTPAVAATRVGRVVPDALTPGVEIPEPTGRPVQVGDVLLIAPAGAAMPMDIWPTVSLSRPHTDEWPVLMHELGQIEDWVRRIAVPMLIVGRHDVPPLPPQLDTTVGHPDERSAIASAGRIPAAERARRTVQAAVGREGLREMLRLHPSALDREDIRAWVASLSENEVLERIGSVAPGSSFARAMENVGRIGAWAQEARAFAAENTLISATTKG